MDMVVGTCKMHLRVEWANSLKEKRTVIKSVVAKTGNKFNISIAEIGNLNAHKDATIGFACVTNETRHAQSIVQNVINFIEASTEAVVTDVETEII